MNSWNQNCLLSFGLRKVRFFTTFCELLRPKSKTKNPQKFVAKKILRFAAARSEEEEFWFPSKVSLTLIHKSVKIGWENWELSNHNKIISSDFVCPACMQTSCLWKFKDFQKAMDSIRKQKKIVFDKSWAQVGEM